MQHKRTITIFVIGALAIAMTFGAIAYRSVFAAAPTTTSTVTTSTSTSLNSKWFGGAGLFGGYNKDDLANALGITVDALNTAYQTAYSAALKQAVTDGLITQAQADELNANGSAFPFGDRWMQWLSQKGIEFNTYLADALNISVDTLKSAYQTSFNAHVDQMVTDGTISAQQADVMKGEYALYNDNTFQTSMQSAFTSAVNAAVASGVITQSQADQILSNNSTPLMPGMGGRGGPAGPHGRGGGFMPDTPPSLTP